VSADPAVEPVVLALFKDGTALATLPEDGFDGFNLPEAKKRFEGSWGTHETKDGEVRVKVGEKTVALKTQPDGSWKSGDSVPFAKVDPATGLKLDGRYAVKGREDKPESSNLVFTPDGKFEDKGSTPPLAGTYEISNNTMRLRFPDRVKHVSFIALPKSGALLINGLWYVRQP